MTKKITVLLLTLLVCFAGALPAFAQTDNGVSPGDYYNEDYTGDYDAGDYTYEDEYADQTFQVGSELSGKNYFARVLEIVSDQSDDTMGVLWREQQLLVEVLEGPEKGSTAVVVYDLSDTLGGGNGSRPAAVGDKVIVQLEWSMYGSLEGYVTMYERQSEMIWLGVIFVVLLVFVGGMRGMRSVGALLITCLGLICVMVPMILNGFSPILASILGCIFSIAVTLLVVYGFSTKSLAAALGSVGGVLVSGIIVLIMNAVMNMTGVIDDDSMYLAMASSEIGAIDLNGVLFAAIIISVLGGAIDVSVSIASALEELKSNAPKITGAQLMKSGVNIGVDIMGASLNTLILSYVGCAIHVMLIFYAYQFEAKMVFNDEMIVCELLRALAGSFALLFTVPITSFVSAMMMSGGKFGKFSWDCFASVVIFRKVCQNITRSDQEKIAPMKLAQKNAGKEEQDEQ